MTSAMTGTVTGDGTSGTSGANARCGRAPRANAGTRTVVPAGTYGDGVSREITA